MIIACYILHYGKEWLRWSLRSVLPYVDEARLFYTPFPSHGHSTVLHNPDDRDDLVDALPEFRARGYKVHWHECHRFANEGEHRDYAVSICQNNGADTILVVDADEIWTPSVIDGALAEALNTDADTFRIGMRHFWRSLSWVCDDPAMPVRIIKPRAAKREAYISGSGRKVYHMGYAQTPALIRYKESIHGHKAEWRSEWFNKVFMPWRPGLAFVGGVHPTSLDYWHPKFFEGDAELGDILYDHPYNELSVIE